MKFLEIQSLTASYKIHVPFLVHWSENNCIAVATEKGIEILELLFNPNNKTSVIDCCRHHVEISHKMPTENLNISYNNLVMKASQSEAYPLIFNPDLAPKLMKSSSLVPAIRQILWSPAGLQPLRRCILACITTFGQLSLIGYRDNAWTEISDVSALWVEKYKSGWKAKAVGSVNVKLQTAELQYRVGRVKFSVFTWGTCCWDNLSQPSLMSLQLNSPQLVYLLITASQDGIITLWSVSNSSKEKNEKDFNIKDKSRDVNITIEIIKNFESKLIHISAMCWHISDDDQSAGFLIIGSLDGIIKCFKVIKDHDSGEIIIHNQKSEDEKVNELVWGHQDLIAVKNIICWNYKDKNFICASVKGSHVIFSLLHNVTGAVLSSAVYNTNMLIISGMSKIDSDRLLISSTIGQFKVVKLIIKLESDDIFKNEVFVIQEEEVECNFVKDRYHLHGFSLSRNKVIGCAAHSVSGLHDNHELKEPTKIVLFSLNDLVDPLIKLTSLTVERVYHVWDCLEATRWLLISKNNEYDSALTFLIPDNTFYTEIDTMELNHLIIRRWLFKCLMISCEMEEIGDGKEEIWKKKSIVYGSLFNQIENLLFTTNIFKRCANLLTNVDDLSEFDKESLFLMRKWLENMITIIPKTSDKLVTTLSSACVILQQINEKVISNQLVLPDHEKCCVCDEIVDNSYTCIYCDGILQFDKRIIYLTDDDDDESEEETEKKGIEMEHDEKSNEDNDSLNGLVNNQSQELNVLEISDEVTIDVT